MAHPDDPHDEPSTLPTRAERPRRASPTPSNDPESLPEGYRLGKYRLVRPLGAGGMGQVYEAVHVEIGKSVAIKVLDLDAATNPRARARFLQEAAAASRISHPNVVNVTDYGTEQGMPFLVMQLLRGEDLGDRLHASPRGLPIEEVAETLLAVCAGVRAAHDVGIVHRDLKPRNIFLARLSPEEISPKVLDFGISKVQGLTLVGPLTSPGALLGTTHYLSPEQLEGVEVDHRTDQYALGVVAYECLTGRRPFDGDTPANIMRAIAAGKVVPLSRLRPEVPTDLEAAVLRALARSPSARFPDVVAFGAVFLPHASARRQATWSDFYQAHAGLPKTASRRNPPPPAERAAPTPPPPTAPPTQTEMLSRADAKGSDTRWLAPISPPPEPRRPEESVPSPPPPPSGSLSFRLSDHTASVPRKRGWVLPALCLLVVLASAGRLLLRVAAPPPEKNAPASAETAAAPAPPVEETAQPRNRETVVPTPLMADEKAPPAPAPVPADVTITVTGAPPGLVAVFDGREHDLPLRLPRASTPLPVIFRAPGFEPRQATIPRDSDQTLEVVLRQAPAARPPALPRGARPKPAAPPAPTLAPAPTVSPTPTPGPIRRVDPLTGAPIIDP